ncbi:acetyl-CoA synthetase-like protein [Calocera cornea HHB12733]|uniref:Acetyl-CoA synthetase-like protein n=1 Tax=Calocera cornea HHB12733 TaxID=1353952 RepID=A0A165HNS4_9BASI|nr:acetyl-CoA synthetase-like protein [Calocera cornea HHB12733]
MPDFHSSITLPYAYPRNFTVPQFLLDEASHPLRPTRLPGSQWLIDDLTGRAYGLPEIRERVARLARAVKARWGLDAGDVVCIYSQNHIDYPIVIWAMHRLGCTVTGANPAYMAGELEYQLKETSAKLLFTSPSSLPVALEAASASNLFVPSNVVLFSPPPPETSSEGGCFPSVSSMESFKTTLGNFLTVQQLVTEGWMLDNNYVEPRSPTVGDTVAFLGFSSGTTGLPKATEISHRNMIAVMLQMSASFKANQPGLELEERWVRPGDRGLAVLPFYHIYGLAAILHAFLFAGPGVVVSPQFHLQQFLETIVKHRVTHLPLVPPIIVLLTKSALTKNYDLSGIRWVVSGAAPISEPVLQEFRALLPQARIGAAYGLTETSTLVSLFDMHKPPVPGSSGVSVPDTAIRIVKPDGHSAKCGEPGEIWVKGPQVALGYLNNKKATEETFLPGGWLRTGDEGYVGTDGNLYVVDRLKELIKVSGFQVAPAELEGHLLLHPYVQDAGVVGIEDDYKGEVPLAFVALKEHVARQAALNAHEAAKIKQELSKWVSDNRVHYKRLQGGIQFVETVPKNPSGKILRRVLRDQAKEITGGDQRNRERRAKL